MKTTNKGQYARTVLSIDEMMAAYVTGHASEAKGNEKSRRRHEVDLKSLGLPENATLGEIREAVRMRTLEQLDLSDDASDEEIMEAMNARRGLEIDEAIESGDYDRWKALVRETPDGEQLTETITQENFKTYKELQENMHIAEEIAEELNLPSGRRLWNEQKNRLSVCSDPLERDDIFEL